MEEGDACVCESGDESACGLRGQGDFGDEDQGGFILFDDLLDEAHVDFGFAGAGDAVDEVG